MPRSPTKNMFNNLPAFGAVKVTDLQDELDRYLSLDRETVQNVLVWWFERHHIFPLLSRMALDYLSIPGACILYFSNWFLTDITVILLSNFCQRRACF